METMSVLRKGPVSVFMCADLLSLFELQVSQDLRGCICVDEVVSVREFTYYMHGCTRARVGRNLVTSQMVGGSRGPCVCLCLQMDVIFKLA